MFEGVLPVTPIPRSRSWNSWRKRGAGGVVDLATDFAGAHIVDLARLAPVAIQIVKAIAT